MCVYVCGQVLDCVFGNSDENVQTAYKVCKFMYCAVVQMCVKNTFDSIHVHFNHLGSFLPRKCVHELHKISCNSYYILITQQRPERGASKYFRIGATAHEFLTRNTCAVSPTSSAIARSDWDKYHTKKTFIAYRLNQLNHACTYIMMTRTGYIRAILTQD